MEVNVEREMGNAGYAWSMRMAGESLKVREMIENMVDWIENERIEIEINSNVSAVWEYKGYLSEIRRKEMGVNETVMEVMFTTNTPLNPSSSILDTHCITPSFPSLPSLQLLPSTSY